MKRTADGVTDLRTPLREASKYLVKYYSGVAYASRGSVFGERWPKLSPAYERRKLKKWGSRPMLIASGEMQANYDFEVRPMSAKIFNNDPKFKYHQSTEPRTRIPRRATIGVNDTLQREVNKIVNRHVQLELERG